MAAANSESVQSLVLNTLSSSPPSVSSNDLTLKTGDGKEVKFVEGDDQVLLKGVLDSLASKEVSYLDCLRSAK